LEDSIMAQKSSGKSQGRSRPQAQSKNQGRASQSKQNPDSGRGGGGKGAANGTASRSRGGQGSQQKGRAGSSQGSGSEEREQSQTSAGGGGAGKVGDKLKQHPITTAALGAGLTLLAAQGLRMAIGSRNSSGGEEGDENSPEGSQSDEGQDEGEEDEDARDASASGDEGEDEEQGEGGGGFAGRLRQGVSSLGRVFGGSGDAIKRGAKSGFDRGRQGAEQGWTNHPLFMCAVALAAGTAAGFLLPSTRQEDRLMGETSDKVAGRFKKGGKEAFRQGRTLAGKVLHEAVNASARETEREGLTPDRLGKKFKRVFTNVRDAVAEAVQED
jgi:hypothetical protein